MDKNFTFTLDELAAKLNAMGVAVSVVGDRARVISGVAAPEDATSDMLCPVWDERAMDAFNKNPDKIDVPLFAPRAFLVSGENSKNKGIRDGIALEGDVGSARGQLPKLLALFDRRTSARYGLHGIHGFDLKAAVASGARVDPSAWVGPCAVVEDGAVIEANVVIEGGAFIGEDCHVGAGTIVEANAVLRHGVRVGKNCLLHSGCVLGADGFGFTLSANGPEKIPQLGIVEVGDNVEIGACTTIDRATMPGAKTIIGSGTKIDNHVQIGHNVKIGRCCIICSMTGIAGSSVIEDGVTLSVQVGVTDHVRIGHGALLAARSGVTNDIPAGAIMSGFPARPHTDAKRALVLSASLPDLFKRLRTLERKLDKLASASENTGGTASSGDTVDGEQS